MANAGRFDPEQAARERSKAPTGAKAAKRTQGRKGHLRCESISTETFFSKVGELKIQRVAKPLLSNLPVYFYVDIKLR
jgi:hypothetical protein